MRRRWFAVVLVALASAAPAAAAPVRLGPAPGAFWQVGSDLFFATTSPHRTFDRWRLHRRPTGGVSRVVASVDTTTSGNIDLSSHGEVEFFPTPTHVAISQQNVTETGTDASGDLTLSFGPYGAPRTIVATCSADDGEPSVRPLAAEGSTIAYLKVTCDLSPTGPEVLVLHDAGGTADRSVPIAPDQVDVSAVALAGGFAAYATGGFVFVVDRATGAPVYNVAVNGPFVLQADGKVAWVAGARTPCAPAAIAWASAAEPTPHILAVGACRAIRFIGDRIVYGAGTAIHVVTLAGADRTVLPLDARASVDGGRITFAVPGCSGGTLWTGSVDDPALAPPVQRSCPLRIVGRRLTLRRGAVRVALSCPHGCRGILALGRGKTRWGTRTFSVTGPRRMVRLLLGDNPPRFRTGQRRTARLTVYQDLPGGGTRTRRAVVSVRR